MSHAGTPVCLTWLHATGRRKSIHYKMFFLDSVTNSSVLSRLADFKRFGVHSRPSPACHERNMSPQQLTTCGTLCGYVGFVSSNISNVDMFRHITTLVYACVIRDK